MSPSWNKCHLPGRWVHTVCVVLAMATMAAVLYQHYVTDSADPVHCQSALSHGIWLNPSKAGSINSQRNTIWQPEGCMLHEYHADDIKTCLDRHRIHYIGDSSIRTIFWATVKKLDRGRAQEQESLAPKHSHQSFQHHGVSLEFFWDPFLNTSGTPNTSTFRDSIDDLEVNQTIRLIGGGLWFAKYFGEDAYQRFFEAAFNASTSLTQTDTTTKVLGPDDLTFIAPMWSPRYKSMNGTKNEAVRGSYIAKMNTNHDHRAKWRIIWAYWSMLSSQPQAFQIDRVHVTERVASMMADLILNVQCNTALMRARRYPMDGTCCLQYPTPSWILPFVFVQLSVSIGTLFLLTLGGAASTHASVYKRIKALSIVLLVIVYCCLADRTHLYTKNEKSHDILAFMALTLVAAALGLVTVRRSQDMAERQESMNQPYFSRHQSDEMKGWMQCIILIYHYTGTSTSLPVYKMIRLLVSSYLFMTGYGHSVFYLKKADFSLERSSSVLLRVNLLSVMLAYIMDTDYVFYYFAPLTSFWFIVVYLTLNFRNTWNKSLAFVCAKILTSAVFVNFFIRMPGLFEYIFGLLHTLFGTRWNVQEWRFRVELDSLIVFVGMLVGALNHHKKLPASLIAQSNGIQHPRWSQAILQAAPIGTLLAFCLIAGQIQTKPQYNSLVPYISCFPILSFLALRNSTKKLRNYHSMFFAWIGRCSLETFTLQFHIWLAADTKGLLGTGIVHKKIGHQGEFLLLTILFLWISSHVAHASATVTSWMIDRHPFGISGDRHETLPKLSSRGEMVERSNISMQHLHECRKVVGRILAKLRLSCSASLRIRLSIVLVAMCLLNWMSR